MALGDGVLDLGTVGEIGTGNLDLGATGADIIQVVVSATTRKPVADIRITPPPVAVVVNATTRKPVAYIDIAYDPNLLSDVVGQSGDSWRGATLLGVDAQATHAGAALLPHAAEGAWAEGPLEAGTGGDQWRQADRATAAARPVHREGEGLRWSTLTSWRGAERITWHGRDAWREGGRLDTDAADRWHQGLPHPDAALGGPRVWRDAAHASKGLGLGVADGRALRPDMLVVWRDAALVTYVTRVPTPGPGEPPWEWWGADLCLWRPLDNGLLDLGILPGCQPVVAIPRRRSYLVIHSIEVVRLPDRLAIPASNLSIEISADAWAWSWSGTLLGAAALDAVLPTDDQPVTLEVAIDGYTWQLLVEEWSEDRSYGSRAVRVSGRGLSAWLAEPYQLPGSGISAYDRTIQQLLAEQLPVGEGWTLTWEPGLADWLVPAGAWSWQQKAPMSAIHEAAQSVGLIVVPSRATQVLHIAPRYRVLPWNYATTDPDLTIPDSAILALTRRRQADAQANAVYVHGGEVGGIQARVYRALSAADRLANSESSQLITHVDAARALGSRILAAHQAQPELKSITMPLGGVFALPEMGDLLAVELGADTIRGTVSAIQIAAARAGDGKSVTVRQTLTLGEDTGTAWARFKRLLPADPLLLGEATIVHADGTVTVTLLGGGTVRVRGTATQGGQVYVRSGQIQGEAPDLVGYDVEV